MRALREAPSLRHRRRDDARPRLPSEQSRSTELGLRLIWCIHATSLERSRFQDLWSAILTFHTVQASAYPADQKLFPGRQGRGVDNGWCRRSLALGDEGNLAIVNDILEGVAALDECRKNNPGKVSVRIMNEMNGVSRILHNYAVPFMYSRRRGTYSTRNVHPGQDLPEAERRSH